MTKYKLVSNKCLLGVESNVLKRKTLSGKTICFLEKCFLLIFKFCSSSNLFFFLRATDWPSTIFLGMYCYFPVIRADWSIVSVVLATVVALSQGTYHNYWTKVSTVEPQIYITKEVLLFPGFFPTIFYYHWGEEYCLLYRGLHYVEVHWSPSMYKPLKPVMQKTLR